MDDFSESILYESRNEWSARLVSILTPHIIAGYKGLFSDAVKICKASNENEKYLMTFQNVISQVPKWNATTIETERRRICTESGCNYLDDLITCVHIIQLKILSAMRVGLKQKKIDIAVPKLDDFIHKVYCNVARKVYKNVYLFQVGVSPLKAQQNHRGLELIVHECILHTIRDNIPEETLLRAYLGQTVEEQVTETIESEPAPAIASVTQVPTSLLTFNDTDYVRTTNGETVEILAPKTLDRLEEISTERARERKLAESDGGDDNDMLSIGGSVTELPDLVIDDIEIL